MLGLVVVPDGGLLSVGKPFMLAVGQPAVQNRFMLPLVGASAKHQRVFHPDAHTADMETRFLKGAAEVESLRVRMENVGRRALRQMRDPVAEGGEQKLIKRLVAHAVVLDGLAISGFIGHVVRRVGDDQIGLHVTHQAGQVILAGGISAEHMMPPQRP